LPKRSTTTTTAQPSAEVVPIVVKMVGDRE
jgi:hypothetical protein